MTLVGLDAEWRPSRGPAGVRREWPVSLLQLALEDTVYLIDLLALMAARREASGAATYVDAATRDMFDLLFSSPALAKVGFGLNGEVLALRRSYPWWIAATAPVVAAVDLRHLACAAVPGVRGSGLAVVVRALLGEAVDKREQTSDWQRRPLTPSQRTYAALDAAVLCRAARAAEHLRPGATEACMTTLEAPSAGDAPLDALDPVRYEIATSGVGAAEERAGGGGGGVCPAAAAAIDAALSYSVVGARVAAPPAVGIESLADAVPLPLTPEHVRRVALTMGVPRACMFDAASPSPSADAAAAALGVTAARIVKTLGYFADGAPVVVLAAGDTRIDVGRLAAVMGVPRRRVRMADSESCVRVFGYPPGSFPPFGHRTHAQAVVDAAIVARSGEPVFCGGGSETALVCMTVEHLIAACDGRVAEVTELRAAAAAAPAGATTEGVEGERRVHATATTTTLQVRCASLLVA
jgi:prolyl-tRNA editing enzyme YbaK/EbsC (Cys-tRNA(Pro) deacylase)